jgi:hypothetical protein
VSIPNSYFQCESSFTHGRMLPNLALWDQGAPPSAARCHVALVPPKDCPAHQPAASLSAGRRARGTPRLLGAPPPTARKNQSTSRRAPGRDDRRRGRLDRAGYGDRRPATLRASGQWAVAGHKRRQVWPSRVSLGHPQTDGDHASVWTVTPRSAQFGCDGPCGG